MVKIKNLRNEKPENFYDIKVDRSSIFGNPYLFFLEGDREFVCDRYERWFYEKEKNDDSFQKALFNLVNIYEGYGQLNLFCWCAPKRCHAETIKRYILKNSNLNDKENHHE